MNNKLPRQTPKRRSVLLPAVFILAVLGWATPVFAYIDPGTGSAILQGILAALAAIALTAKLYWHRLLKLLGLRKDTTEASGEADGATGDPASSRED